MCRLPTAARFAAGFGVAATLVLTLAAAPPANAAPVRISTAPAACPIAPAHASTAQPVLPADDVQCKDTMFSDTYDTVEECDEAGQQIQDENGDVVSWYCWKNTYNSQWALHVITCKWVDGVEEAETWIDVNSSMYLDVSNQSMDNGAPVHQWTFTGADNQWWLRILGPDGYFRVVNLNSGKCLGVSGSSLGNGTQIVQWDCNGSEDQQWSYRYVGTLASGWPVYNIVDRNSGKCLGIIGGSTDIGGNAVQWDCNGHADQEWY